MSECGSEPGNPLLAAFGRAMAAGGDLEEARAELVAEYAFGIPTRDALEVIARHAPSGVVEIGAGRGYWAHLLDAHGVDVAAFDLAPPPSGGNQWFVDGGTFHEVRHGDASSVVAHADRTLLLVWPTRDEVWAAEALATYQQAGGQCVVYVGEPPGGRTGDDVFHAMLGELETCAQCRYGITTAPCICEVERSWERIETLELPRWPGQLDSLSVHRRARPEATRRWRRMRSR